MNKQVSYAYQHLSRTETYSFLGNGYDCIRKNLPLELEIGYFKNREFVGINSNTFE